jgi:hypothetical protein
MHKSRHCGVLRRGPRNFAHNTVVALDPDDLHSIEGVADWESVVDGVNGRMVRFQNMRQHAEGYGRVGGPHDPRFELLPNLEGLGEVLAGWYLIEIDGGIEEAEQLDIEPVR